MNPVKRLIWLYLILLIFEGALRKWVAPEASGVLLLVRDPVVVIIYITALGSRMFPINIWISSLVVLAIITTALTWAVGHQNAMVWAYGIHTNFLHLPLIFVMGVALNRNDVWRMGKFILWLSLPMALLMGVQMTSPKSAWVNRAVGGEFSGMVGALGRFRPPGTFSFITGAAAFFPLVTAFVCAGTLSKSVPRFILFIGTIGLALAIVVSISRLMAVSCAVVLLAFVLCGTTGRYQVRRFFQLGVIGVIALFGASWLPAFDEGIEASTARWMGTTGGSMQGFQTSIVDRILNMIGVPVTALPYLSPLGGGLGISTKVGAHLLGDAMQAGVAESEWLRVFAEIGVFAGTVFIAWRVLLSMNIVSRCFRLMTGGSPLPWMLFAATAPLLLMGQWGQTTILGFAVFGTGLALGAMRVPKSHKNFVRSPKAAPLISSNAHSLTGQLSN